MEVIELLKSLYLEKVNQIMIMALDSILLVLGIIGLVKMAFG